MMGTGDIDVSQALPNADKEGLAATSCPTRPPGTLFMAADHILYAGSQPVMERKRGERSTIHRATVGGHLDCHSLALVKQLHISPESQQIQEQVYNSTRKISPSATKNTSK